jgi:hypothetical protein
MRTEAETRKRFDELIDQLVATKNLLSDPSAADEAAISRMWKGNEQARLKVRAGIEHDATILQTKIDALAWVLGSKQAF